MGEKLSRERLYELVWSVPRTALAKELGVSDVWIAKQCRAMNIPMPPRGYWANKAAGSKAKQRFPKPPLPYSIAQNIAAEHAQAFTALEGFRADHFDVPVPKQPHIAETIDDSVNRRMKMVTDLQRPVRRATQHQVVQKLVAEDERRAADDPTGEKAIFSWWKPRYIGAEGQRILAVLDELAWHWTDCGFRVTCSRSRDIELFVAMDGHACRFEVQGPESLPRAARSRRLSDVDLELRMDDPAWQRGAVRSSRSQVVPLKALGKNMPLEATRMLLSRWEAEFRESVKGRYEHAVQQRAWAIKRAEDAAQMARQRREEAARKLLQKRYRLLIDGIKGVQRADEIRALVDAICDSGRGQAVDPEMVARWRVWALRMADDLDPRSKGTADLENWLREFGLN